MYRITKVKVFALSDTYSIFFIDGNRHFFSTDFRFRPSVGGSYDRRHYGNPRTHPIRILPSGPEGLRRQVYRDWPIYVNSHGRRGMVIQCFLIYCFNFTLDKSV